MIAGTKKQRTKRPGIGATSGADAGSGVGSGRDVGSGAGATDGIGAGSGADSAAGSAADSGIGAGVDASSGAGVTDGSGAGVDASPGAGVTAGSGAGNATGKGAALPPLRSALDFAVFILIIAGFFLACLIAPKPDVLVSERRRPAELPAATTQNLTSARFQNSFEGWTADNFPLREAWRTARSLMVFDVLLMTDKEGLYWGEAGAGKIEPVDVGSVEGMADKLEGVVADLGSTTKGLSFYYAVIPDKSLYDGRDLPGFDPDVIARVLEGRLTEAKAIDLCAALGAKDFYRSDLHWDLAQLGEAMALEEGDDGTVKGLS
ncbi:MAG: hypothetical protein LBG81_02585, partial [Coriobacteriaceae bacterium]|nr:hypothetical protein [Coriobacteriaceae bacterium]